MTDQEKIKIQKLKTEDSQFAQKVWTVAESAYKEGSPWTVDQLQQSIAAPNSTIIVASLGDGEMVGLLIASQTMIETDVYLVAVSQAHQQKGIGSLLFDRLIEESEKNNIEMIFLEVRESNQTAYQLYLKKGFKEIGRRKNYYSNPTEDALMMKRETGRES